ncbi:MAG: pentapeptide repeat-containing protein [Oligoflexus sp.]
MDDAVDFSNANFRGANLSGAIISTQVNFSNADFSGATWVDGRICGENSIGACL